MTHSLSRRAAYSDKNALETSLYMETRSVHPSVRLFIC